MFLCFGSVATDKMSKFIKIYNIEITVSVNHCIFTIMIMPSLITQLLPLTNALTTELHSIK